MADFVEGLVAERVVLDFRKPGNDLEGQEVDDGVLNRVLIGQKDDVDAVAVEHRAEVHQANHKTDSGAVLKK